MRKLFILLLACPIILHAQDDFDMSAFEEASDAKVFVNNKVLGLSPTKLLDLSFDYAGSNTWSTTTGDAFAGNFLDNDTDFNRNYGLRLNTNYPVISNNRLIVNAYLNYWESNYRNATPSSAIGTYLETNKLRTTAAGAFIFKPLNDRNFLLFQVEGALNGNYNFDELSPDFGKMKYSIAALYGWKTDDYTNIAVGMSRTYRGGRLLYIPALMYNKTFNETWGLEMLLPARAELRRNFSTKSFLKFGYELEGQSYHIQGTDTASPIFASTSPANDWELRKSEIRTRISWDKAITDFIWFNVQAGAIVTYRMDFDLNDAATNAWLTNDVGIPFYFRFGIQLVSP